MDGPLLLPLVVWWEETAGDVIPVPCQTYVLEKNQRRVQTCDTDNVSTKETYCKGKSEPASVFLVQFSGSPQPEEEREVKWMTEREDLTKKTALGN